MTRVLATEKAVGAAAVVGSHTPSSGCRMLARLPFLTATEAAAAASAFFPSGNSYRSNLSCFCSIHMSITR